MLKNPLRKLRSKYNVCIFIWKKDAWRAAGEVQKELNKDRPVRKPSVREIIKAKRRGDTQSLEKLLLLTLQYKTKEIQPNIYATAVDTMIPQPKIQSYLQMIAIDYAKFLDDRLEKVLTYEEFLKEYRGVDLYA